MEGLPQEFFEGNLVTINNILASDPAKLSEFTRLTSQVRKAQHDLSSFLWDILDSAGAYSHQQTSLYQRQSQRYQQQSQLVYPFAFTTNTQWKLPPAKRIQTLEEAKQYLRTKIAGDEKFRNEIQKLVVLHRKEEERWYDNLHSEANYSIKKFKDEDNMSDSTLQRYVQTAVIQTREKKKCIFDQSSRLVVYLLRKLQHLKVPLLEDIDINEFQSTVRLTDGQREIVKFVFVELYSGN